MRRRTVVIAWATAVAIVLTGVTIWLLHQNDLSAVEPQNRGAQSLFIREPGVFPIADGRVTLEVLVGSEQSAEELKSNLFTSYVEQKLGIDLKFVRFKPSELDEAKGMLFASGDYPPIILSGSLTPDEQVRYGERGILRQLDEWIDQYGSRLKEIYRQNPGLERSLAAPDGHIYALPSVNECLHCWYAQKLWINTTWLHNLNLEMPRTTEEFYQVLRAFKQKDPNGNGVMDEIPLSGARNSWHTEITGFLMSAFIYNTNTNYFYVEDGTVGLAAIQPQWREGLGYIRKLFREGLIDPDVFTQSIDGLMETASHRENVLGAVTSGHIRMAFANNATNRSKEYEAVPPLIGPSGYQAAGFFSSFDRAAFAITDKATDVEAAAAVRLADFLLTEEATIRNEWGPADKWWREGQPGEYDEHGRPAKYWLNPEFATSSTENDLWAQMGLLYRNRDLRESWSVSNDPDSFAGYEHRLYAETLQKYAGKEPPEVYPDYIFMDVDATEEAARLRAPIEDYIETNLVKFITGIKNIDVDWQEYVEGLKRLKLDRYLEIHQKAYDKLKLNP